MMIQRYFVFALLALLVIATAACNAYNPDLGNRPFRCGDGADRCPEGYRCVVSSPTQEICERLEGGTDGPDSGSNFNCADDSSIEPNEDTASAFTTPIPDTDTTFSVLASICDSNDVDVYRFGIDIAERNLRADISFDAGQTALALEVLNTGGTPIRFGEAVSGNPGLVRAEVMDMPPGEFFISVKSTTGLENNYSVEIEITGP